MNIAYITKYESVDIKNWSGTEYFMAKSLLEQNNSLYYISNLEERLNLFTRFKYQYNKCVGRKYFLNRSPYVTKEYSKQVLEKLTEDTDIIFSPGTIPIAHLKTSIPKVFYTDATFASMIDYYDWFKNLSKSTIKEGMKLDQRALDTCDLAIFSSDWAAQSAITDYKCNPEKVKVVPLGANIECELPQEEVKNRINNRSTDTCKLLFVGVEWERKGGDLVLDTTIELNRRGIPTELHIVGLPNLPIDNNKYPFIFNHGFISKKTEEGLKKMELLFSESHFLFVPSQAEAYGLVFCEAAAYGLPSIATQTGGISTIIKDNINGITYPLSETCITYADFIQSSFSDSIYYKELAIRSYQEYRKRLSWNVAGQKINQYLKALL